MTRIRSHLILALSLIAAVGLATPALAHERTYATSEDGSIVLWGDDQTFSHEDLTPCLFGTCVLSAPWIVTSVTFGGTRAPDAKITDVYINWGDGTIERLGEPEWYIDACFTEGWEEFGCSFSHYYLPYNGENLLEHFHVTITAVDDSNRTASVSLDVCANNVATCDAVDLVI